MATSWDVAGLNIVIVGGTTGLGLSAAKALVTQGARVVVCGRSQTSVDTALQTLGANARGFAGDALDPDTADKAVGLAAAEFGSLDALYHVAGGSGRSQSVRMGGAGFWRTASTWAAYSFATLATERTESLKKSRRPYFGSVAIRWLISNDRSHISHRPFET